LGGEVLFPNWGGGQVFLWGGRGVKIFYPPPNVFFANVFFANVFFANVFFANVFFGIL